MEGQDSLAAQISPPQADAVGHRNRRRHEEMSSHARFPRAVDVAENTLDSGVTAWLLDDAADSQTVLAAFSGIPPRTAPHGHYWSCLEFFLRRQPTVESVLPDMLDYFADAWGVIGDDRLVDRAAVSILLARAIQLRYGTGAGCVVEEVAALCNVLPVHREILDAALRTLRMERAQSELATDVQHSSEECLRALLREASAREALRYARTTSPPDEPNARLRWLSLAAHAAQRAESTGSALEILTTAQSVLAKASPDAAYAYHLVKNSAHWLRLEHFSAFRELEAARRCAAKIGSPTLLFWAVAAQERLAAHIGLPDLRAESARVLGIINLTRELLEQAPLQGREFSVAKVLGVATDRYTRTVGRARELQSWWKAVGHVRDEVLRHTHLDLLRAALDEAAQQLPSVEDEPSLFAHFRTRRIRIWLEVENEMGLQSANDQLTAVRALDQVTALAHSLGDSRLAAYLQRIRRKRKLGSLSQQWRREPAPVP